MTITIAFPAGDKLAAEKFGHALLQYASDAPSTPATDTTSTTTSDPLWDDPEEKVPASESQTLPADTPPPAGFPTHDEHGVAFDATMCARAKDPFMKSGKYRGRWKKRQGVDQTAFDNWHAGQCGQPGNTNANVAADAFATKQSETQAPSPAADFGSLMTWVAEKQQASRLTIDQINNAYATCNTTLHDLARPDNLTARQAVYTALIGICGV